MQMILNEKINLTENLRSIKMIYYLSDINHGVMKKKTPYLDFYYKCVKDGNIMPVRGLCEVFGKWFEAPYKWKYYHPLFELMFPEPYNGGSTPYWGSESEFREDDEYKLTPLRQNIVLFMAAMNGEL